MDSSPPDFVPDSPQHAPTCVRSSWWGRLIIAFLFAALIALKLLAVLHYRFDSDEPQHLHVVWGWAHGFVQYRDLFDNHTPLFHLLSLPLFNWIGERGETLLFMRFCLVPLFFFCIWSIYRLGVAIKSVEVGIWSAIFAALTPALCYTFTEYRADDLWAAFWMASLVVLLGGKLSWPRGFFTGLLFGAAVATSLKTLALLGCLAGAAVAGCLLTRQMKAAMTAQTSRFLAALLAGFVILPLALAFWFSHLHALHEAAYGIFTYNAIPGLGRIRIRKHFIIGFLEFASISTLLIYFSRWAAPRVIAPRNHLRFHLVFLGSGIYGTLIYTLWPLLDAEHLIPCQPIFVVGLIPVLLDLLSRAPKLRDPFPRAILLATIALAIIAAEAWTLRIDNVRGTVGNLALLLRLSDPNDYIMDLKGESVFRPRPYPYLFEGIGIHLAKTGRFPDSIPEQLIATGTCIAVRPNRRFTFARAMDFMDANYLSVGPFRVLGHTMTPSPDGRSFTFHTCIPQTFSFVERHRLLPGGIDGHACPGFATLAPGDHTFIPDTPRTHIDFVWKQAIDRKVFPEPLANVLPAQK